MITYDWQGHKQTNDVMRVKLDGKPVGVIRLVPGGYAYVPYGSKQQGQVFKTTPRGSAKSRRRHQPTSHS